MALILSMLGADVISPHLSDGPTVTEAVSRTECGASAFRRVSDDKTWDLGSRFV